MGAVFSLGERCQTFFEKEAEKFIEREGLSKLKKRNEAELYRMMFGEAWLKEKLAEIQARNGGTSSGETIANEFSGLKKATTSVVAEWHEKAREWDVEPIVRS